MIQLPSYLLEDPADAPRETPPPELLPTLRELLELDPELKPPELELELALRDELELLTLRLLELLEELERVTVLRLVLALDEELRLLFELLLTLRDEFELPLDTLRLELLPVLRDTPELLPVLREELTLELLVLLGRSYVEPD